MTSYDHHFFFSSKALILSKIGDFSVLNHVKTHFGHFLQILKKGSPQIFLKKISAKMPDLREKCAYIKIYDIIWSSSFLLFKNNDFEQNSWFFGPKSRSSVGGFPYQCREFITEITNKNEALGWIWVKIAKSLLFHHVWWNIRDMVIMIISRRSEWIFEFWFLFRARLDALH